MNNGGPAFPCDFTNDSDVNVTAPNGEVVPPGYTIHMQGMSLRDYFAATALPALIAAAPGTKVGEAAYEFADQAIAAR